MEKYQNNKVEDKERNAHCVAKLESKWNSKSLSYSTTRCSNYLALFGITSKKNYHIPSSGPSYHPCGSPSVAMNVHTSILPSITPTEFPSDVQVRNQ